MYTKWIDEIAPSHDTWFFKFYLCSPFAHHMAAYVNISQVWNAREVPWKIRSETFVLHLLQVPTANLGYMWLTGRILVYNTPFHSHRPNIHRLKWRQSNIWSRYDIHVAGHRQSAAKCLHFLASHHGGQNSWHRYRVGMKKIRHCQTRYNSSRYRRRRQLDKTLKRCASRVRCKHTQQVHALWRLFDVHL